MLDFDDLSLKEQRTVERDTDIHIDEILASPVELAEVISVAELDSRLKLAQALIEMKKDLSKDAAVKLWRIAHAFNELVETAARNAALEDLRCQKTS